MKRVMVLVLSLLLLTGCGGTKNTQDKLLQLREKLSQEPCGFTCHISADFGSSTYDFTLDCGFDTAGNMDFTVKQPDTISGITGHVAASGGNLTFDDKAVAFSMLAEGELTPISAPWLMMKGLRSGYLSAWAQEKEGILLTVDDSFHGEEIQFRILLSDDLVPISAEILKEGSCVLSLRVDSFRYL